MAFYQRFGFQIGLRRLVQWGPDYTRRYTAKVAELRKTDLRIDWSEVSALDGPRRIALGHSELIEEPI
jgi:hypothetical protein